MRWLVLALALSGCTGVVKMGLKFSADVFGVKVKVALPLEHYPVVDGGYPPEALVCE